MATRSAVEVKARCMSIIKDKEIIDLVKETETPSAAFEVVSAITKDYEKAKAARWLAILRRDYPDNYYQIIN